MYILLFRRLLSVGNMQLELDAAVLDQLDQLTLRARKEKEDIVSENDLLQVILSQTRSSMECVAVDNIFGRSSSKNSRSLAIVA